MCMCMTWIPSLRAGRDPTAFEHTVVVSRISFAPLLAICDNFAIGRAGLAKTYPSLTGTKRPKRKKP